MFGSVIPPNKFTTPVEFLTFAITAVIAKVRNSTGVVNLSGGIALLFVELRFEIIGVQENLAPGIEPQLAYGERSFLSSPGYCQSAEPPGTHRAWTLSRN